MYVTGVLHIRLIALDGAFEAGEAVVGEGADVEQDIAGSDKFGVINVGTIGSPTGKEKAPERGIKCC